MKIQRPLEVYPFIIQLFLLLVIFEPMIAQQQKETAYRWQTWLGL